MDDKLVGSSLSDGEGDGRTAPHFSYTDTFYEAFPHYLAMGMTYEQYWNGDVDLVRYYKKAQEIKNQRKNQELWLQGMYIYEVLCDVAPIYHAFAKSGTKPRPYSEQPYPLTQEEQEQKEERARQVEYEKGLAIMKTLMKNGGRNGDHNS